jgi:hypothetical protein
MRVSKRLVSTTLESMRWFSRGSARSFKAAWLLERTGFETSSLIASTRSAAHNPVLETSFGAYQSLKDLFVVDRSRGSVKDEQDKHQEVPRFMQRLPSKRFLWIGVRPSP